MKFYPALLKQYKTCLLDRNVDPKDQYIFDLFIRQLESPQCKRVIFDARQAKVFDDVGDFDAQRVSKIRAPFKAFYCEFTDPIMLKSQEPGFQDACYGFMYWEGLTQVKEILEPSISRHVSVTKLTFFFRDLESEAFVDRTWSLSPELYAMVGKPLSNIVTHTDADGKPAKFPPEPGKPEGTGYYPTVVPEWAREDGTLIDARKLTEFTWWDKAVMDYTNLLHWCFAYMMAKSVTIVPIPDSRQVRRYQERKGIVPNPWHIVKVEPKFKKAAPEMIGGEGSTHSYRYDVIGHLRFGRHKKKDGSYVDTIEWVGDHQRGLEHELYIPKTYAVESGKKIAAAEMQQYLNQPETKDD